jgi:hypothetical protein
MRLTFLSAYDNIVLKYVNSWACKFLDVDVTKSTNLANNSRRELNNSRLTVDNVDWDKGDTM